MARSAAVLCVSDIAAPELTALLARYGLTLTMQPAETPINASFWGAPEAGIAGTTVYARADTPLHSLLHEACHVICMTAERRADLHQDAGGDDLEEAAVCYLQIVLADEIAGVGRALLMQDMDAWGYSFRLGNTLDWFQRDAEDAREFLVNHELLDTGGRPVFRLRI